MTSNNIVLTAATDWRRAAARLRGRKQVLLDDLSLFAGTQFFCTTVLVIAAKAVAVYFTFRGSASAAALRNMTLVYAMLPASIQVRIDTPPPSREQAALVQRLMGTTSSEGERAFAALPRRRHNVLMVVWESVGERYLRDHHPLGVAETPHLHALEAAAGALPDHS
jgi:hypothetical protein